MTNILDTSNLTNKEIELFPTFMARYLSEPVVLGIPFFTTRKVFRTNYGTGLSTEYIERLHLLPIEFITHTGGWIKCEVIERRATILYSDWTDMRE